MRSFRMVDELEEIRRRKLAEMQYRGQEERARQEQVKELEHEIKRAIKEILTPEARSRLANIRMAKPEYATQIELLLIKLAQSGQIRKKIGDAELKEILRQIASKTKKDFKIRRV